MLMLRCGLRVEEVADLSPRDVDLRRRKIMIAQGKGGKGRVVYISNDAFDALVHYLSVRPSSRAKKLFLVEKGSYTGKAISVRGIQKRMEYYAKKARLKVSCHHLRHHADSRIMPTKRFESGALLTPLQFKSA
jgi:site-specific recombinase XerC